MKNACRATALRRGCYGPSRVALIRPGLQFDISILDTAADISIAKRCGRIFDFLSAK